MPRYIDADEAIRLSKEDKLAWVYDLTDLEEFLVGVPTADVVPKSEVEELKKAYANYEETTGLKQAKQELAREIFEEIERQQFFLKDHAGNVGVVVMRKDIAKLKKKYSKRYFKEDGEDTNVPTKVSSSDICVVCGEPVPEGRQICSMCETGREFLNKKKG